MSDANREPEPSSKPSLLDRLRQALGIGSASIRDDIEDALEQSGKAEDFSPHERAILRNVLELHEHRVQDIMIPRADIIAVSIDSTLADVLTVFRTAGHSRLPVHGETLDDPRGMVHIRDFVDYLAAAAEGGVRFRKRAGEETGAELADKRSQRLAALGAIDLSSSLSQAGVVRPVLFVPPSMPALDLLVKMQATRTHMGLVIDEYGGTEGLVSIEDVVEMIVGDIEDEHDIADDPRIERVSEREFMTDARATLAAVSEHAGVDLENEIEPGEIDTLAGYITSIAGRVPARGEIIRSASHPVEFEIVDADPRRIKRVRLRLTGPDSGDPSQKSSSSGDVDPSI